MKGRNISIKERDMLILYTDFIARIYRNIIHKYIRNSAFEARRYPKSPKSLSKFKGAKNIYGIGANAVKNNIFDKLPPLSKIFAIYSKNIAVTNHKNMHEIMFQISEKIKPAFVIVPSNIPLVIFAVAVINTIVASASLTEIDVFSPSKNALGVKITLYIFSKKLFAVIPINIKAFYLKSYL